MHGSSMDKMRAFTVKYLGARRGEALSIIDVGSQDIYGCYREFFAEPDWRYVGVDLAPGDNVDLVLADPYDWREIATDSVDVLVSGQAFEHIEYFWLTMGEITRVLKPGGLCCIIAPSRGEEHRYPVDCWRFYADGLDALGRYAGLEVLEARTQWGNEGYADGSDAWGDSILVARKPEFAVTEQGRLAAAAEHRVGMQAVCNQRLRAENSELRERLAGAEAAAQAAREELQRIQASRVWRLLRRVIG